MTRCDVAIVGGGPVGVALAIQLGQRGVHCTLIERRLAPQPIPKGQNLTNRTLEHFYFWQCLDQLRAARVLPPGYPTGGVTVYQDLTSPYFHVMQWGGRGAGVQEHFFQREERLPQYCTEAVLRDRLTALPSVTTLFGWSAEQIQPADAGVRERVVPTETEADAPRTIEAQYVVGCDGGRSLVRESMAIDRGQRDFDQRMVLAVFRSAELHAALQRFPESATFRVLKPELRGYWQFFGRVDVGETFFFHAPVPNSTRTDAYDFLKLLHEAAGFPFRAQLDHVGFWDLRIAVASQYRLDRAFIAGDACHQHPPYGGFGLNTGFEDAVNLGWKLAAVLAGWGGSGLLDSYGEERRPIFVETGEVMIAGGIERDRRFLERYDPSRDLAEFERAWADMGRDGGLGGVIYEPHYAGSPVVYGPAGASSGIHGEYSFAARPGHHLSPRALSSGRNVYEVLGQGFTLLALDADAAPFSSAAAALAVPLDVIRDTDAGGRETYGARLVLVRPDQHVAWCGDAPPSDPVAVLTRVTGRA